MIVKIDKIDKLNKSTTIYCNFILYLYINECGSRKSVENL